MERVTAGNRPQRAQAVWTREAAAQVARQEFGMGSLRDTQWHAVDALVNDGRDVFLVAATGSGKSLCYQLPPLLARARHSDRRPFALVLSPLVALMNDQADKLNALPRCKVRGKRGRGGARTPSSPASACRRWR